MIPSLAWSVLSDYLRTYDASTQRGSVQVATELHGLRRQWFYEYGSEQNPIFELLVFVANHHPETLRRALISLIRMT